jgi:uncharacterized membrane protein
LDAVTVDIVYGNGNRRTPKIFLQKDASVDKVIVQSEQFSQEVELGGSAAFDLNLELFSGTTNTFKLEVANLPQQINRYFIDPSSEARLSQFKFTERTTSRRAALQIFLPDRPSEQVMMDRPIMFYVLVIPRSRSLDVERMTSEDWNPEDLDRLNIGYVRLELVPRGIGKLLVRAPQLYHSIRSGEEVHMAIDLVNEGSRRLDNVEMEVDAPLNWQKIIDPEVISSLEIRQEKRVRLVFTPPNDIGMGRYEFRVRTSSLSDDQTVHGEDKTVTVEVQPRANVWGTVIIVFLIVGIIVGIVVFGIRLSRR